jgi:radical SAM protein with 4Fe4S-binding SPASM domain
MKYRKLKGPLSVQVEITEACNMDCFHCYNHWREKSGPKVLSRLAEGELMQIVRDLISLQVSSVTITGGEPLIYWSMLPPAIAELDKAGIEVGLNSNVALLTEPIAQALWNAGLRKMLVSVLCGNEAVHDELAGRKGAWARTMRGIDIAVHAGFLVSTNMVLSKRNFSYLRETAEVLVKHGIDGFCATKASPALNSRNFDKEILTVEEVRESMAMLMDIQEELGIAVDVLECYPLCLIGDVGKYHAFARRNCGAGVTSCTIGSNGDVRPCSRADMVYGNVFQDGLLKAWESMEDWRAGAYIPPACDACDYIEMCSAGCRMEAKYLGDIHGNDPFMSGPYDIVLPQKIARNADTPAGEFKLANGVRVRDEEFGGVVFVSGGSALLNNDAMRLVQYMMDEKTFSTDTMAQAFPIEREDAEAFLRILSQRGIVESAL